MTHAHSREPSRHVTARDKSILLVEDNDDIRDTLEEILIQEGFQVATATNGLEALDVLAHDPLPCLILLDLRMPVMDGVSFRLHQLRDPRIREVPVVVLTAANEDHREAALLGACGHLRKPIDLDVLLETAEEACRVGSVAAH